MLREVIKVDPNSIPSYISLTFLATKEFIYDDHNDKTTFSEVQIMYGNRRFMRCQAAVMACNSHTVNCMQLLRNL